MRTIESTLAGIVAASLAFLATAQDSTRAGPTPEGEPDAATEPAAAAALDEANAARTDEARPEAAEDKAKSEREMSTAEIVMAAQAAGYRVVNERGTQLFCRTDDILGSRLRKKTRCLTAAQIEQEKQAADRAISDISKVPYIPPGD